MARRKRRQRLRRFSLPRISVCPDDGNHHPSTHDREMPALPHALLGLALFGPSLLSGPVQAAEPLRIEVFTTPGFPILGKDDGRLQGATVTVCVVDGLEQFESALSEGLPNDAQAAKAEALRRIGELNGARVAPAKESAMGLAKASQYGLDRYPAIVFDGTAVVYGVTDLVDAVARYDSWHEAQSR